MPTAAAPPSRLPGPLTDTNFSSLSYRLVLFPVIVRLLFLRRPPPVPGDSSGLSAYRTLGASPARMQIILTAPPPRLLTATRSAPDSARHALTPPPPPPTLSAGEHIITLRIRYIIVCDSEYPPLPSPEPIM